MPPVAAAGSCRPQRPAAVVGPAEVWRRLCAAWRQRRCHGQRAHAGRIDDVAARAARAALRQRGTLARRRRDGKGAAGRQRWRRQPLSGACAFRVCVGCGGLQADGVRAAPHRPLCPRADAVRRRHRGVLALAARGDARCAAAACCARRRAVCRRVRGALWGRRGGRRRVRRARRLGRARSCVLVPCARNFGGGG
eukprot:153132-Chlamydomonas_euryale.AAC.2